MKAIAGHVRLFLCFLSLACLAAAPPATVTNSPYFGIRIVDEKTHRGVPLVELRTVNDIVLHTDSAGWVAFLEPGLMNREVYFALRSPGFEFPRDGFGNRGIRLKTTPGKTATLKLKRTQIAERLYRITGQGIYRDSSLLGLPVPLPHANLNSGVVGQDSVQAVPYRGRLFWLWGDTNLPNYPLGNFQTSAATSPLAGKKRLDPAVGIPLTYFTDPDHPERVRAMVPFEEPGPVWLFGLLNVRDVEDKETLIAHFTRHKSLTEVVEHGLVRFDDARGLFQRVKTLDSKNSWRFPHGNAFRVKEGRTNYFYFAAPMAHTRVKATWQSVIDPTRYEAWAFDSATRKYTWRQKGEPTTQEDEQKMLRAKTMTVTEAHHSLVDSRSGQPVRIHGASIAWNTYRKKWILIGNQFGDRLAPSLLGEVWYAESDAPTGPWRKAVKVATHPRYSFYNPRHHAFFDEAGGRVVYFEGTYTRTFSGNPVATPRYEYNQILYRLDLGDKRLFE